MYVFVLEAFHRCDCHGWSTMGMVLATLPKRLCLVVLAPGMSIAVLGAYCHSGHAGAQTILSTCLISSRAHEKHPVIPFTCARAA